MGLLSWFAGKKETSSEKAKASQGRHVRPESPAAAEVPGLNGAIEVRRPEEVSVFEFGSAAASGDKVTLAGYCPVSDELEPCRWEILPASGPTAPQFRIVF